MEQVEAIVVGAGVVGLAIARALALRGRETVILEAGERIGAETSSRNSEVIHAGLYYPPGSLKARLCVAGRSALYRFCADHGVPHKKLGKLIVATEAAQLPALTAIAARARACGVDDLAPLSGAQAQELEPNLACVGALHSPSTGILDAAAFMRALLGEAEAHGAALALKTRMTGGRLAQDACEIEAEGADGARMVLKTRLLVNAAGLEAQSVAASLQGLPAAAIPPRFLARGCYFGLSGRAPFRRLIYPVPVEGGLGVHLTLDMGAAARFGPDVEWIAAKDYTVDPRRAEAFYGEIRRYWPELPDGALHPDYAGVRPKISGPGAPAADFRIDGPADHGRPGLVNLFGIESPGLTASLAIADHVVALLEA